MSEDRAMGYVILFLTIVVFIALIHFTPGLIKLYQNVRGIEPVACGSSCQYDVRNYLYAQECLSEGITDFNQCIQFIEETHNATNE